MPTKTDYFLIAVGALIAVVLASKVPQVVSPMSSMGISSLDKISGIDINSLYICRQKGLM